MRKFSGDKLLVATHNAGKLDEIRSLTASYGLTILGGAEMKLAEPKETGTTFVENARIKAHAAARATQIPALADDSGLEVIALNNAPGVYTADWAETESGRDFVMAMERIHRKLIDISAPQPWKARFCCTLALAWPDGHDEVFEGIADGQIVWPMRGVDGHGYDPIFQPNGHDLTYAELNANQKNAISHRADAFHKFMAGCFG